MPVPLGGCVVLPLCRSDLIDCMVASGYIPGYIGLRPVLSWRRMAVVDGGLVHAVPKGEGLCVFPFLVSPEHMVRRSTPYNKRRQPSVAPQRSHQNQQFGLPFLCNPSMPLFFGYQGVEDGREYICPLSSRWVPGATAIKYMFFPPVSPRPRHVDIPGNKPTALVSLHCSGLVVVLQGSRQSCWR